MRAHLKLEACAASAHKARWFVAELLARSGTTRQDNQLAEKAILLVSELVTNAVVHANSPVDVVVDHYVASGDNWYDEGLRIEVSDHSLAQPQIRNAGPHATGGRGMALVAALSTRWGVETDHGGKRVWCELRPCTAAATSRY